MDARIMGIFPFTSCIAFKPINTGCHIPWSSNTPRHIKVGCFSGELVRALRIFSHPIDFDMGAQFWVGCMQPLSYPALVYEPLPQHSKINNVA